MANVVQDIRGYLDEHPNASDTLDGIISWWLSRQRYENAREVVRKALDQLQSEGVVMSRKMADGRTIYWSSRRQGVREDEEI